jgi:hypothetical protein
VHLGSLSFTILMVLTHQVRNSMRKQHSRFNLGVVPLLLGL